MLVCKSERAMRVLKLIKEDWPIVVITVNTGQFKQTKVCIAMRSLVMRLCSHDLLITIKWFKLHSQQSTCSTELFV